MSYTVVYGAGTHTLTRQQIGTRYGFACIRILVISIISKDVDQVHSLQDAVKVSQAIPGCFENPKLG